MDDEFLYKLRIDPPSRFAVRLKARLDRRSHAARRTAGWSLLLVLCGTALALSLPHVRQSIARLIAGAPEHARSISSPSTPAPDHARTTGSVGEALPPTTENPSSRSNARRSPLPAATHSGEPQIPPALDTRQSVATSTDPPVGIAIPRIIMLLERSDDGRTPGDLARQAVATRRGVFLVMQWAMNPVTRMLREQDPVDADAAAASATRIQSLAPVIADVYAVDTRPFAVDTQSLDKIWSDLPGFDLKINRLAMTAYELNAAAQGRDPQVILLAAGRVSAACSGCHAAYRKQAGDGSQ